MYSICGMLFLAVAGGLLTLGGFWLDSIKERRRYDEHQQ